MFSLNGKISNQVPCISLNNRAFLYGDALFETMRADTEKIFFAQSHYERLCNGLQILKMKPNPLIDSFEKFKNEIFKTINKEKTEKGFRIRMTIFRNSGGLYTPTNNNSSFFIETSVLPNKIYQWSEKGVKTDIFSEIKKPINKLSNLKTTNCLPFILAGIFKKENNLDDCILLNEKDRICEGLSSNIFIIKNNEIKTPCLSEGCVAGVMRKQVLEISKKMNLKVSESQLTEQDLKEADEIFLTNSIWGIYPISEFRGGSLSLFDSLRIFLKIKKQIHNA